MSLLLEPGGGPLGRLLVRVFDGLVSDVNVADRSGQPPVTQQLLDRGQADALAKLVESNVPTMLNTSA